MGFHLADSEATTEQLEGSPCFTQQITGPLRPLSEAATEPLEGSLGFTRQITGPLREQLGRVERVTLRRQRHSRQPKTLTPDALYHAPQLYPVEGRTMPDGVGNEHGII